MRHTKKEQILQALKLRGYDNVKKITSIKETDKKCLVYFIAILINPSTPTGFYEDKRIKITLNKIKTTHLYQ